MTIKKDIGRRLRQIRASQKLTQNQMAKKINVSPATISGWEIGDYGISIESVVRMAQTGKVSLDWLLTGKNDAPEHQPEETTTPEEQQLLAEFRRLSKTSQAAILRIVEMMQK